MATTSVTYNFDSDAQGWTGVPETGDSTVARFDDSGDWCFRHLCSGRNKTASPNYAYISDTWENLFSSLPAGSTVTGVKFGGCNEKCGDYDTVDELRFSDSSGANTNAVQYRGTSNIELWAGKQYTGTTSWAAQGPAISFESVPAGDQASSTTVEFRVNSWHDNANSASAATGVQWDDLVITIEYTEPPARIPRSASMCPILGA